MKKIDVKARLKNKAFWVSMIALIGMIVQFICDNFGISFDTSSLNNVLTAILSVCVASGIVVDTSTKGWSDASPVDKDGVTIEKLNNMPSYVTEDDIERENKEGE